MTWLWRKTATTTEKASGLAPLDNTLHEGSNHSHFFGHPQSHAPRNQAQPDHEIILLGAVEVRHGITEQTGVDEEARNTRDRVMLFSVC